MGYVGNEPSVNFTSFAKQDITGDGGASYTLTHAVANANEIEVFVNNVRQEPTEAYTVSGTALTMTGNVASTDDFYVIYLGKALQTTTPPDASVGTAKIADSAVTNAKIANSTIDLTSKVTGVLPVANGGTGSSSSSLIAFDVTKTNATTAGITGVIDFDVVTTNIGNGYDTSTGRFTAPVAGTYEFTHMGTGAGTTSGGSIPAGGNSIMFFRKNGSASSVTEKYGRAFSNLGSNSFSSLSSSTILTLAQGDYVEVYYEAHYLYIGTGNYNNFTGKLIGAS